MKKICITLFGLALVTGSSAEAQTANPLSAGAKRTYEIIKGYVTRAAEKAPEDMYAFKPTPDVRSFGQLVGHVADANFGFCAAAAGEKPPAGGFRNNRSRRASPRKADLQKALADSFAYCDKIHATMTDAEGGHGSEVVLRRDGEALDARVQHPPRFRALRQHGHLHAAEGHRAALIGT